MDTGFEPAMMDASNDSRDESAHQHCPPWDLLPDDIWAHIIGHLDYSSKLVGLLSE
jgi:hypothetical protein